MNAGNVLQGDHLNSLKGDKMWRNLRRTEIENSLIGIDAQVPI